MYTLSISRSTSAANPSKRPYLRAEDRRRQLLDATGRLFDRVGFGGITMSGLATEAGVSRQLVYDHFGDLDSLYLAFIESRLAQYRGSRPDITTLPPDEAATAMFRHLLTIPAADRRIIRLLVADVSVRSLDPVRRRFRADELTRWPAVTTKQTTEIASTVIWTVTSALLALADAVTGGDVDMPSATNIAVAIVGAVIPFAIPSTRTASPKDIT